MTKTPVPLPDGRLLFAGGWVPAWCFDNMYHYPFASEEVVVLPYEAPAPDPDSKG